MSGTHSVNSLEQTSDPTPTGNPALSPILDAVNQALGERLGVGGMGEVYRIGDSALQRDLAIKVLKADLRGNADAEERFLREARLTGSLQHPAIVPVHQLRRLADSRPYYTMKLVRGRTFADLIREEAQGPERLPRLLAIVEKVCQAVAYAHSKGVIHRDLKPSNVMVGEFGEVQVMDWGLAKELSRDEPTTSAEATREVETVARVEAGEGLSRAGLALGTPEYMPPEQAAGDWDIVDQRADVFALGAILCAVLTGRPPSCGGSRDDLLRRARRGDLAEALGQLEKCGADAVLVVLSRECLAAERLQRPRHAGAVAERLAAYQAEVRERLRLAELERARSEVKALEERKRRRLLTLVGIAAFVLVVGGVATWWQWRAQADKDVAEALAETRSLREQAISDALTGSGYDKALAAAQRAKEMAGSASAAMRRQADELFATVRQEAEAAAKDRRLLAALLEVHSPREGPKFGRDNKGKLMLLAEPTAEERFASAFHEWGLDVDTVPVAEAVARVKARPTVVVTEIIAALDEWASQRRQDGKQKEAKRVADLAAALDDKPSSLGRELRDILGRGQLPLERALGALSRALRPVPLAVEVPLGEDHRRLRSLAVRIDAASESVLGTLTVTRALQEAGEEALAERLLRAALIAHPREVVLYHTLGRLLTEQKPPRSAEAVEFYRAARGLRPDLGVNLAEALLLSGRSDEGLAMLTRMVQDNPDSPFLHFQLGNALYNKEKFAESVEPLRKAIELNPNHSVAHFVLGLSLYSLEKPTEAEAAFRKTIALLPDHPPAHYLLGQALNSQGKYAAAESAFSKAIALQPNFSPAYCYLGDTLVAQEKHAEAEAAFCKAIDLRLGDSQTYAKLGWVLYLQGKYSETEAASHKAIALKPDFAYAYTLLGAALVEQGKKDEAEAAYRKVTTLDPDNFEAYSNLGGAFVNLGKNQEAEDAFRKAITLKPDNAEIQAKLGAALLNQGKNVEAEKALCKAITLEPDLADTHCYLGVSLQSQGRFKDSLDAHRRGHELGSKQRGWSHPSLQWVREAERMVDVEKKLPAILRGEASPANADDAVTLAWMCGQSYQKRYAASARLYAHAFTAEPKLAADMEKEHRYNAACSAALATAGQGEDARSLPDKAAVMFRRWALGWLRDDLAAYAKLAEQKNPAEDKKIEQRLAHWRRDADLASLRDPQALERFPESERAAWQALWRDVDDLLRRVEKREGPTKGR